MQTPITLKSASSIKALVILLFLLVGIQTYAQKKFTDNLNGMVNSHFGYNIPEYPFIASITEDYIRSLDICFFKETTGKNKWEQLYNYPSYGVSFFYSTLGNDEVFGRELALTYFFKLYFLSKNRFRLFSRTGIGMSYVNRKFDFKNNYLNVAVGSNVNIHFNSRIGANYILSDKFSLNAGLSFNHFSNANTSEPNLGINYLTGYGGVSYRLGKKTEKQIYELEAHVKENTLAFFVSLGGKYSGALVSNYFSTSSFSLEYNRAFTRKFHFGIGSDIFYDSSVESRLQRNNQDYKKSDNFQTGIHLSQSIVYNKLTLSIQEGVYLFLTEPVNHYPIYTRGIVQYQINNRLLIRLAMKSHFHILDYPEIGFGYKF
jgi:hypothetical protein